MRCEPPSLGSQGPGAAVYVHIPFCRSLCTYCGCNTRITRNRAIARPYLEAVLSEWDLYLQLLGIDKAAHRRHSPRRAARPHSSTPKSCVSSWTGSWREASLVADAEFSVEADPRVTTPEQLATLRAAGFRRLSLGHSGFRSARAGHRESRAERGAGPAADGECARARLHQHQLRPDLRTAAADADVDRTDARRGHAAAARPDRLLRLRARAVDQAQPASLHRIGPAAGQCQARPV